MFNIHIKRGNLIVESFEGVETEYVSYKIKDISYIKFEYFDREEADSGFLRIVLKNASDEEEDIDDEYGEEYDDDESDDDDFLFSDHSNQYDWDEYDEPELLCEIIVRIARKCAGYKIDLRLPDIEGTPLEDFLEKFEQQKVAQWWKDDFIFRHIFSRN